MTKELAALLRDHLTQHPNKDDLSAALWPGRNYAGGGEWRRALDWPKRLDYDSFYRRRGDRSPDITIPRLTANRSEPGPCTESRWSASQQR